MRGSTNQRNWSARGRLACVAGLAAAVGGMGDGAMAQTSVTIPLNGVSISTSQATPADVVRTSSPATISAAPGYLYTFNPISRTTGLLGLAIAPTDRPLGDIFNVVLPGSYRVVYGASRTPGTLPAGAFRGSFAGEAAGLTLNLTLSLNVRADGVAEARLSEINKPVGLGLAISSGGATLTTFTPPAAIRSEWHFDGSLQSVKESGLYPSSGPSKIRPLDDAAFGPILGVGNDSDVPANPPTPQGVTMAQSAFGAASSFGLPAISGGADDVVYRISPPRNLSNPSNTQLRRGIGLALWPNTRDFWPDDKIGAWTMVWDLLIPSASFASEFPLTLIEDSHNNDESADMFIRTVGGVATVGYQTDVGSYVSAPTIQPNQWFRLALVSDGYNTGSGRLFVNGTFIGTTDGDWIYNSTKSAQPRYGNVSAVPVAPNFDGNGTLVPAATWNGWGQFPSPWSFSGGSLSGPMASTVCLFSDLQGRGETAYVANMAFSDEALSDAAVAGLGGPDGRGIFYLKTVANPCPADFNDDSFVDDTDFVVFAASYEAFTVPPANGRADFNGDGFVDDADFVEFAAAYEAFVCP